MIFVLLTAYFQSPRLSLIRGAVPGVLAGIAVILYFTNTSLNIESFMGSIMCLGVSVSNSVMLVTFMDEHWKAGRASAEAAVMGWRSRLRPILMTACAMTVGMVPMARTCAWRREARCQALGLAVIGRLVMRRRDVLVLPSVFAVVIGKKVARSASIISRRSRARADITIRTFSRLAGLVVEPYRRYGIRRAMRTRGTPADSCRAHPVNDLPSNGDS